MLWLLFDKLYLNYCCKCLLSLNCNNISLIFMPLEVYTCYFPFILYQSLHTHTICLITVQVDVHSSICIYLVFAVSYCKLIYFLTYLKDRCYVYWLVPAIRAKHLSIYSIYKYYKCIYDLTPLISFVVTTCLWCYSNITFDHDRKASRTHKIMLNLDQN